MADELLNVIFKKMPMQEKKIRQFFERYPEARAELDLFLSRYCLYMTSVGLSIEELAEAYSDIVFDVMDARMHFIRTGCYCEDKQSVVVDKVYGNGKKMGYYMMGLALSQFLWEHHYRIWCFFSKALLQNKPQGIFLEVGSGHGLYTLKIIEEVANIDVIDVVDISETSLKMTQGIIESVSRELAEKVQYYHADVTDTEEHVVQEKYDWITMGEVLEHVEEPKALLKSLKKRLRKDGKLFITTCVNSPAIDHVYHFKKVQDIRDMIEDCGYKVVEELVSPSENREMEWLEQKKIDISYAAVLEIGRGINSGGNDNG